MKIHYLVKSAYLFRQSLLTAVIVVGLLCFGLAKRQILSAEPSGNVILPDYTNSLSFSYNQQIAKNMLEMPDLGEGMQPILDMFSGSDMTDAGAFSMLTQLGGSVRVNGLRLSMSSPWLPVMNRSRPIGQWENHIIAKNNKKITPGMFSDDGTIWLAQSPDPKKSVFKGTVFEESDAEEYEIEYEEYEEYEAGSEFGGLPVRIGCLGKHSKNLWFAPVHSASNFSRDSNTPNFHISRTGFMAGLELGHCPCTNLGVAFGYTAPMLLQEDDEINADDIVAGLYFRKKLPCDLYVNGWLGYGHQDFRQERFVRVPDMDLGYKYEGKFDGDSLTSCVEVSRAIYCKPCFVLRPLVAFDYQRGQQGAFQEAGQGPFALYYDKAKYEQTVLRCGFAMQFGASDGSSKMSIRSRIYYGRQIGKEPYPDANMSLVNGGSLTTMNIRGIDISRDYMMLGLGGQFYIDSSRCCQIFGDYDAIVTNNMTTHTVSLGLIQRF